MMVRNKDQSGASAARILFFYLSLTAIMPGTHLLPPNLLKLFAPRPPLPYARPIDHDINRVKTKNVSGVGAIISALKEAATENLVAAGTAESMEEGEEPAFTHAEEVKRQIRREERRQRRTEEFKTAKETCTCRLNTLYSLLPLTSYPQISQQRIQRLLEILIKLFSFLVWCVLLF